MEVVQQVINFLAEGEEAVLVLDKVGIGRIDLVCDLGIVLFRVIPDNNAVVVNLFGDLNSEVVCDNTHLLFLYWLHF